MSKLKSNYKPNTVYITIPIIFKIVKNIVIATTHSYPLNSQMHPNLAATSNTLDTLNLS